MPWLALVLLMSIPSPCPAGQTFLNCPGQPDFDSGIFTENFGATILPGSVSIPGRNDTNPFYVAIGGLNPDRLQVKAVFDFQDINPTFGALSPIYGIGAGLSQNLMVSPVGSVAVGVWNYYINAPGGKSAVWAGSAPFDAHEIARILYGTYTNAEIILTSSALKMNGKFDLTTRYINPSLSLDITNTFVDYWVAANGPVRLVIVGPTIDDGSGYLNLKNLVLTGFGFPNSCPGAARFGSLCCPCQNRF